MKTPLARTVFSIAPRGRRLSPDQAHTVPMLEFALGDITLEDSDAIVIPVGGGLVQLAVQRAAGPALAASLREKLAELAPPGVLAGQLVVTEGFGLRTQHVFHAAMPRYADDAARARSELAACYVGAIAAARRLELGSISFPALATGAFRFPIRDAAPIATRVIIDELRQKPQPRLVRFVFYGPATLEVYVDAARRELDAP